MKRVPQLAILVCAFLLLVFDLSAGNGRVRLPNMTAHAEGEPAGELFGPDRALMDAMARSDVQAVEKFLDTNFTWTDSQGRTLTRKQVLEKLPEPAIAGDREQKPQERVTSRVVVHRAERGNRYVLRVWVKRPAGWRVLVYQEVVTTAAALQTDSDTRACVNPCKSVPFQPKTADEAAVIHAYQSVERAVTAHDAAAWGALIADGFFAVTSNSDRPQDKPNRMAGLAQAKSAGIAPFPLVSARMSQFGDTMVMTSRQQPEGGKALHVTRIWVKQHGKWLEMFSYQTTIQGG